MHRYETEFTKSVDARDMLPTWSDDLVPRCSERCPSHDGKRCQLLGFRPAEVCEPAVHVIALRAANAFDIEQLRKSGKLRGVGQ